jgi:hypothetical protein
MPARALTVRFTKLTLPVHRGAYASVRRNGWRCLPHHDGHLQVVPVEGGGLGPKTANAAGAASWTWLVGPRTTPGRWPVTVTCSKSGKGASVEDLPSDMSEFSADDSAPSPGALPRLARLRPQESSTGELRNDGADRDVPPTGAMRQRVSSGDCCEPGAMCPTTSESNVVSVSRSVCVNPARISVSI